MKNLYLLTSIGLFHPKKHSLTILNDVNGYVKPGRMTLLLGPPGAGKSTLLLALTGKLAGNLKKSGEVTYNGHRLDEFYAQRTAAYISQSADHIAEITVPIKTLVIDGNCGVEEKGLKTQLCDVSEYPFHLWFIEDALSRAMEDQL